MSLTSINPHGLAGKPAAFVDSALKYKGGEMTKVAERASSAIASAEDNLVAAFSLAPGDRTKASELAKKLGIQIKAGETISPELLQTVAKANYEKSARSISMVNEIFSNAHQLMMKVINSIRAAG